MFYYVNTYNSVKSITSPFFTIPSEVIMINSHKCLSYIFTTLELYLCWGWGEGRHSLFTWHKHIRCSMHCAFVFRNISHSLLPLIIGSTPSWHQCSTFSFRVTLHWCFLKRFLIFWCKAHCFQLIVKVKSNLQYCTDSAISCDHYYIRPWHMLAQFWGKAWGNILRNNRQKSVSGCPISLKYGGHTLFHMI